ncbi:MAG: GAF domain-containing protein, partial [Thermoanaerobaculia bacterium]
VVVSALQVVWALAAYVWGDLDASAAFPDIALPARLYLLPLVAFPTAGALLLVMGRDDVRASRLGLFFLLLGAPFANRWLLVLIETAPRSIGLPTVLLRSLHADSFFAWAFWLFAHDFPQAPTSFRVRRLLRWGARASLLAAAVLAAWQLWRLVIALDAASPGAALAATAPDKPSYGFYSIVSSLAAGALATLLWRARRARGSERRRVTLFLGGLALGLLPLFLQIGLGSVSTNYRRFFEQPRVLPFAGAVVFLFLVSIPFSTAYAVLVHHVLDVKLLARQALQYALARGSAITLIALPLAGLATYLYLRSDRTLAEVVSGQGLWLVLLAALGVAALSYRKPLLEAIDRRFFREQYNARRILTVLVHDLRAASDANEVSELTCREVDRALHLESAALLVADPRTGTFVDLHSRTRRRLDSTSSLARLVADGTEPLDTDLEGRPSPATRLPEEDRRWLGEQGAKLMVPIPASDGTLLGIIVLGAKRSGLPFLAEDRLLLRDIANSAAMGLELSRIRAEAAQPQSPRDGDGRAAAGVATPPSAENARECPN